MIIKRHIFAVILLIVFLLASGCGVNEGPETSPAPEIQATPVPAPEAAPTPSPAPEPDPVAQQICALQSRLETMQSEIDLLREELKENNIK